MTQKDLIKEFDRKLRRRKKGISRWLIFPNFVDEFTKSTVIMILFYVFLYHIYLKVRSISISSKRDTTNPIVEKIKQYLNEPVELVGSSVGLTETGGEDDPFEENPNNVEISRQIKRLLQTNITPRHGSLAQGINRILQTDDSEEFSGEKEALDVKTLVLRAFVYISVVVIVMMMFFLFFGNTPQFACSLLMILIFGCTMVILILQFYAIPFDFFDFKIFTTSCMMIIAGFISSITKDRVSSGYCISSFHANRAFVYEEYCFQRMFGRASILWGMRFGKYPSFADRFIVKREFIGEAEQKYEHSNQEKEPLIKPTASGVQKPSEKDQVEPKSQKSQSKFAKKLAEISIFKKYNQVEFKEKLFMRTNQEDDPDRWWIPEIEFDDSIFEIDYKPIYDFYKKNKINHSWIIKKSDHVRVPEFNFNKTPTWKKTFELVVPFSHFKRQLFIRYPYYFPAKLMIGLYIQVIIQVEIVYLLILFYNDALNQKIKLVVAFATLVKIPLDDIFRSVRVSFVIIIVLFILISLYATIRMLMSFKVTVMNMRLNGIDSVVSASTIWSSTSFIQSYLGNITFSSFPFLFIFFVLFACITSVTFWRIFWSLKSFWIVPFSVFLFELIFDLVFKQLTKSGFFFKKRKLIRAIDMIKMFLGFYSAIFTGFLRFFISVLCINITMFRVDKTGLPKWIYDKINVDSVNKAYNGLVRLYHTHNNPLVLAFVGVIMDQVTRKRAENAAGLQGPKKVTDEQSQMKQSAFKTGENSLISKDADEEMAKNSEEEKPIVDENMLLTKREKFLKVAYRWQYYAMLVRNPKFLRYVKKLKLKKQEEEEEKKKKEEEEKTKKEEKENAKSKEKSQKKEKEINDKPANEDK